MPDATVESDTAVVWMDDWQLQCCGDPFSVGARITWAVEAVGPRFGEDDFLGAEITAGITHAEDHHCGTGTEELTGRVRSIKAVWVTYGPARVDAPGEPLTRHPVPGSARTAPRQHATGSEPETEHESFIAYIVEVTDCARVPGSHG